MVESVGALVLFTNKLQRMIDFYTAIGVALAEELHDDGRVHFACELGATHFAIFEGSAGHAPALWEGGCSFAGFAVTSVDEALEAARQVGAGVVSEPVDMPWGRRAVVADPDGRPVELYEPAGQPPARTKELFDD